MSFDLELAENPGCHAPVSGPARRTLRPMTRPGAVNSKSGWQAVLSWAAYLACSWTWCIGMFLPVLLLRDYGVWSFIVFAVPNVIGAAAMGWIIRSPAESQALERNHAPAMMAFTIITVGYQVFFLAGIGPIADLAGLLRTPYTGPLACAVGSVLLFIVARGRFWGLAVWLVSTGLLIIAWTRGALDFPSVSSWTQPGSDQLVRLSPLAPVCAFGFMLCPYLDLTFHRARQATDGPTARWAFGLGFGLFFFAMIVATLGYAPGLIASAVDADLIPNRLGAVLVGAHITLQLVFTTTLHSFELIRQPPATRKSAFLPLIAACTAAALGLAFGQVYLARLDMTVFELAYRCFMAFYGLVFPAYVWLCMIPTWRAETAPTRRHISVWLGACALAAPAYWLGFVERIEWWLLPGVTAVLLARVLIRPAAQAPGAPSASPTPAPTHPAQSGEHAQAEP